VDAAPPHVRPLLALLVTILATACSQPGATGVPTPGTPTPTAPPPSSAAETFPMTLTDYTDTQVVIPAVPKSIVSLTPAATETLFAIGAGDRVVGKVEDIAGYPPEAAGAPIVATYNGVDLEEIVALQPDLVIAGGNAGTPDAAIARMRTLGLPVLVVYAADVDGVFGDIELIGTAVGKLDRARDLTSSMRAGFDQVAAATRDLDRPRVFYETGDQPSIFGVADRSFVAAMLELAGGDPITTGSSTAWDMSSEKLIASDPEVILLGDAAYGVTADAVAKRPGWAQLSAVKAGAIRPIDDIIVTRPGPRLLDGLRALVAAIHPDIERPGASPGASTVPASPASSGG